MTGSIRLRWIGAGALIVLLLGALLIEGVFAQSPTPTPGQSQTPQTTPQATPGADKPHDGGGHHGRGGKGGGHHGPGGRHHGHGLIEATAEVTGLTVEQVRTELEAGKTLAQVAQEHGKSVDDVIANLRVKGEERLNQELERAREQLNQTWQR